MSTADKWIRWSTVVAVAVVAAVAAAFSYQHALDVVCRYSRPSRLNVIYPVAIDGLIYAASMTLLNDARRQTYSVSGIVTVTGGTSSTNFAQMNLGCEDSAGKTVTPGAVTWGCRRVTAACLARRACDDLRRGLRACGRPRTCRAGHHDPGCRPRSFARCDQCAPLLHRTFGQVLGVTIPAPDPGHLPDALANCRADNPHRADPAGHSSGGPLLWSGGAG